MQASACIGTTPGKAEAFAVLDRMRAAGLSFDEIERVVLAVEREDAER